MDIAGKRALVLGGTAGIGLATAQDLERRGAQVAAASRSATSRERAKTGLGEHTTLHDIDVRDRDALSALFESLAPLDILVCAATGGGEECLDRCEESVERTHERCFPGVPGSITPDVRTCSIRTLIRRMLLQSE